MMRLNRPWVDLSYPDPRYFQTYSISAPLATHWRKATCAEADCSDYTLGWRTTVDPSTDLGKRQVYYIESVSGRKYTKTVFLNMTWYDFEPGQRCFASDRHMTRVDRPEIFRRRPGDHRGVPDGRPVVFSSPESWRDDFGEHQERIATEREQRGVG